MEEVINCSSAYVFSVDGALTTNNNKMDPDFAEFFINFCKENLVYLISGYSFTELIDKLGNGIVESVQMVYNTDDAILDDCKESTIFFFGTAMEPHERDYPLAKRIHAENRGQSIEVSNCQETYTLLSRIE